MNHYIIKYAVGPNVIGLIATSVNADYLRQAWNEYVKVVGWSAASLRGFVDWANTHGAPHQLIFELIEPAEVIL